MPKEHILTLLKKERIADNIYGFWFKKNGEEFDYIPGQFLEWELSHEKPDDRGTERYFTIASSPEEENILLATKIVEDSSTFKKVLKNLQVGDEINANGPYGDFILPENEKDKLVFIAGGIGITPFRSMIKSLLKKGLKRNIILFYAVNFPEEIAFGDVFFEASTEFNLNCIYTISKENHLPEGWSGEKGFISKEMIERNVRDFRKRTFYVSGPEPMVNITINMLKKMGVNKKRIKKDYFPGYDKI